MLHDVCFAKSSLWILPSAFRLPMRRCYYSVSVLQFPFSSSDQNCISLTGVMHFPICVFCSFDCDLSLRYTVYRLMYSPLKYLFWIFTIGYCLSELSLTYEEIQFLDFSLTMFSDEFFVSHFSMDVSVMSRRYFEWIFYVANSLWWVLFCGFLFSNFCYLDST